MDGILLVDKAKGWTSFDVVAKVRSLLRQQLSANGYQLTAPSPKVKVGHTGTLDPLATGLLVLLIGKATKQATELSKVDKTYEATIQLGATSTTGDAEGQILTSKNVRSDIKRGQIVKTLKSFVGEIEQVPPVYSAIKVDGQRAYKLARQGKNFELKARRVTIKDLRLKKFQYPLLEITAYVSSGTYIRTLAEDIGKALGTGAYLTNLKRTQVGQFNLQDALNVENISAEAIYRHLLEPL